MEVPAGAVDPDVRDLIARHVPELHYHVLEPYRADSAATITDSFVPGDYSNQLVSSELDRVIATASSVAGTRPLSLLFLAREGECYWESDGPKAAAEDSLLVHTSTRQRDSQTIRKRPGYGDIVYCNWIPRTGTPRYIQYWLFYYHNPFVVLGDHTGDWEMVQVELGDGRPVAAVYHQHYGAVRREWADVPTVHDAGIVPIIYVAKGSHASYFTAGTQRRLWFLLGIANDHTSEGGEWVRPTPYYLDEREDRWLDWPGCWGGSKSPYGPKFHGSWSKPDEVKEPKFAEIEEALGRPTTPAPPQALSAQLVAGGVVVDYELAPRLERHQSDPARLEVAVYGASGPPVAGAFEVTALRGTVQQPLPPQGPPYRVEAGLYDADDNELLLGPLELGAAATAAAESAPARATPPPRPRPPGGAEVRVTVRAPTADSQARSELVRRAQDLELPDGPWTVRPLFADSTDAELGRWFTVAAPQALVPGRDGPAAAIEAAEALGLGDGWSAEPQLPITSYRPEAEPEAVEGAEEGEDLSWALDAIRAPEAWEFEPPPGGRRRGAGIVIAQPDTGFTDHPELELALDRLRDYDVLTGKDDAHAVLKGFPPFAFPSHGTSTASVAVSRHSGKVTGSAPEATMIPIRAAASVAHFFNADLAVAVEHARMLGVHVVTISMGGLAYPNALRVAIQRAVADGVIVMAAAGQPLPIVVEPASFPECLGVGGTERGDKWWGQSARGTEVDVAAPAKKVWVAATWNAGAQPYHVAQHTGTSFSVALVAGVAALWLAHHGRQTILDHYGAGNVQAAFGSLLRKTARVPDGWDTERQGAGIVDARALLAADLDLAEIEAGAAEAAPQGAAEWALERVAALAPAGTTSEQAQERLLALFAGDPEVLEGCAREVVYRLTEEPAVRDEVLPPAGAEAAGSSSYPQLRAVASDALRAALA